MRAKLLVQIRDWVQRCVDSGDPSFISYVTSGNGRRRKAVKVKEDRRKVFSLNHIASEVADETNQCA